MEQVTANPHSANNGLKQVSPRIAPDPHPVATEAGSADSLQMQQTVPGQPAPTSIKSVCRHCRRPITRWLDAEYWTGKPGQQIWYHDDLVDGTEDGRCDGVSCKNETADQDATEAAPSFPASYYRPRFIVIPTGRTIFAWGIWDSHKNPLGSIPSSIFKMSDFVHRTRSLGKAYAFARRLNEKHEQKVAA